MRKMQNCSPETLTGIAKMILYAKASTNYVIPRQIDFKLDIYIKFEMRNLNFKARTFTLFLKSENIQVAEDFIVDMTDVFSISW